jgi:hypothetical protein
MGIANTDLEANRSRFASLAILYGWLRSGNEQFVYQNQPPRLVHSTDHGHFFGRGDPVWVIADLNNAPPAVAAETLVSTCALTPADLQAACQPLREVSDKLIAAAVAAPPDEWGISVDERAAMCVYLAKRRGELLTLYAPAKSERPTNGH